MEEEDDDCHNPALWPIQHFHKERDPRKGNIRNLSYQGLTLFEVLFWHAKQNIKSCLMARVLLLLINRLREYWVAIWYSFTSQIQHLLSWHKTNINKQDKLQKIFELSLSLLFMKLSNLFSTSNSTSLQVRISFHPSLSSGE